MLDNFIQKALVVFKIISALGFIVAGVLIVGLSYRWYKGYFGEKADEYKWVYWLVIILVSLLLGFIFVVLFGEQTLPTGFFR